MKSENSLRALLCVLIFALFSSEAGAAGKTTRFWNLTASTIVSLQFSEPGKNAWGPDQCKNDPDGKVDHDERLKITGLSGGRYDAKVTQQGGRVCYARNVEVKEGGVFSIADKDLTECGK
jgi:hypothetical protein